MDSKFRLISKTSTNFIKYSGDAVRLTPKTPAMVDEVILARSDAPELIRKVTTFRDSHGKMLERNFDYYDKPYKQRIYSDEKISVIGTDELVSSKNVKEYELDRDVMELYKDIIQLPNTRKTIFWMPRKSVTNHFSQNVYNYEKCLSQAIIENAGTKCRKKHSFIEYPIIKSGKVDSAPKKLLSFRVNTDTNQVVKHSVHAENVQKPLKDSYLGYRALPLDDSKEVFSNLALKERGLGDDNIKIVSEYNPLHEKNTRFKAKFCPDEGVIRFNKDYKFGSKSEVVSTSYHEAEHGWHFYLQGRLKDCDNGWQQCIRNKYGELNSPELVDEAKKCDDAIVNYVPYYVNKEAYKNNYIEIEATQKGLEAEKNYDDLGVELRTQFKHIPPELL